jgi:protein-tyrosine phosphatase
VDFLPRAACPFRGRIGLTFAPGKKDESGGWNRNLEADVQRLVEGFGTSVLVSLLEDFELRRLGIEDLFAAAAEAGLRVRRLPIPDGGVPVSLGDIVALVRLALALATAGDTVVFHCRGGLGRAGTLASRILLPRGSGARGGRGHPHHARRSTRCR